MSCDVSCDGWARSDLTRARGIFDWARSDLTGARASFAWARASVKCWARLTDSKDKGSERVKAVNDDLSIPLFIPLSTPLPLRLLTPLPLLFPLPLTLPLPLPFPASVGSRKSLTHLPKLPPLPPTVYYGYVFEIKCGVRVCGCLKKKQKCVICVDRTLTFTPTVLV